MIPDPLIQLERTARDMDRYMQTHHRTVLSRYPLLFALLGAFGVAAIIYGFEGILDSISIFHDTPSIPLVIGIGILIVTGSLYRRLEKKLV
jgi:hypothetical protein